MTSPSRPSALLLALTTIAGSAGAQPVVVTDAPPVHSIVARVMQGVGEPGALLPPGASLHGSALRPSAAGMLARADAVIWVGPALTPWLEGPVDALAGKAEVLELIDADGMILLGLRESGPFEPHDHGREHEHFGLDAHVWLDPRNGVTIAAATADLLGRVDPPHAAAYAANAEAFAGEMAALEAELAAGLAAVADRPYVVFHDAYQYFETRFGIPAAGSIALGNADQPSAAQVAAVRDRIEEAGVVCVFAEPQFEPRLVATVIEGTGARTGTLDPEGASLEPGAELYPALLRGLAGALSDCLAD